MSNYSLERLRDRNTQWQVRRGQSRDRKRVPQRGVREHRRSISPWEDVAETYKYKVLADVMPNQKVEFSLAGQGIKVFDFLDFRDSRSESAMLA